jgi:hypothetical protein
MGLYVSVPCPCCKKVLYNTSHPDGLFSLGTDPPRSLIGAIKNAMWRRAI